MLSLTFALDGSEWSASRPGRFTPRERPPGAHWIGGWAGPRAGLNAASKSKISNSRRESNPRTLIVQPVDNRYTDWATPAPDLVLLMPFLCRVDCCPTISFNLTLGAEFECRWSWDWILFESNIYVVCNKKLLLLLLLLLIIVVAVVVFSSREEFFAYCSFCLRSVLRMWCQIFTNNMKSRFGRRGQDKNVSS
jgi:hypothetical protein